MRISDWSSDVCSSDLLVVIEPHEQRLGDGRGHRVEAIEGGRRQPHQCRLLVFEHVGDGSLAKLGMTMSAGMIEAAVEQPGVQLLKARKAQTRRDERSEENTSELQSLLSISYAVVCLKKKT